MKRSIYTLLIFGISLFAGPSASAQLNAGEIMFVGFNADGTDGFSIVALVDIPASSTIYFTDNEWNELAIGSGGAFVTVTEGEITWSTGGSIINAGTIIDFVSTRDDADPGYGSFDGSGAVLGTISGQINANTSNEVIYAFLGTDDITPTSFLTAISNNNFTTANGSLTNTGLTAGTNATQISGNEDLMIYTGPTDCNSTVSACAADIANATNWTTEDTSGVDDSANGGVDFPSSTPTSFGGTALPVELISFKGQFTSGAIQLSWVTASEINNDYFEIFRSNDGNDFQSIGTISGNGTKTTNTSYQFFDQINFTGDQVYYRLKQVDYDGNYEDFPIIIVSGTNPHKGLAFFPNPAIDFIKIGDVETLIQVDILDYSGRIIKSISTTDTSNKIDISDLNNGHYLLQMNYDNKKEIHKFLKK